MIAAAGLLPWMAAATLFAGCVALVAWAWEGAARAWPTLARVPHRVVWGSALLVGALGPLLLPLVLREPAAPATITSPGAAGEVIMGAPTSPVASVPLVDRLEPVVLGAWLVASLALAARVVMALVRLRRIRRRADAGVIDDTPVLLSDDIGPAAIGVWRPEVLLPRWVLALDPALQRLIVRHEVAHVRSRDALWLWVAVVLVVALPWQPVLWCLARRLRLAVECDCDARTLARSADPVGDRARYARLLLLIAQRPQHPSWGLALAHPTSQLSRRITAMFAMPPRRPRLTVLVASATAVVALAAACSPRLISNLTGPAPQAAPQLSDATIEDIAPTAPQAGAPYFDFQVNEPATMAPGSRGPTYPPALRAAGVSGAVLVQFVVDTDGRVEMGSLKVLRSADSAFTSAVRDALPAMRFVPAQKDGRAVRQLVQQPFQFALADGPSRGAAPSTAEPSLTATIPGPPVAVAPSIGDTTRPYFDFQLDRTAVLRPGTRGPAYPPELRAAGTSGQVLVQFVVDAAGRVDSTSIKMLKADHPAFADAVRAALPAMPFLPAEVKGTRVKALVQMPFAFTVER